MKRLARNRLKSFSVDRLLRHALRHWHADEGWRAVQALHVRGSPQLLATITALCTSQRARRRAVGLAIAGQLMHKVQGQLAMYAEAETHQLLLHGLSDPHHDVVRAAVAGLGHRPHAASVEALLRLSASPDSQMRWQVAVALGSYEEPEAIEGLIRLATDPSAEVRDWATFGLGSLRMDDTPAIRAALRRNLDDPDIDVRGEALVGLARRRDEGIVERLIGLLTPECHMYELDAAEALADPRLVEPLQALSQATPRSWNAVWQARLDEALATCASQSVPVATERSSAS